MVVFWSLRLRLKLIGCEYKGKNLFTICLFVCLQIALLALAVIMMHVHRIDMAPAKPSASKELYLSRAWGESTLPFTVIYSSDSARKKNQKKSEIPSTSTTTTTTAAPTKRNRRRQKTTTTTKRPSQYSNLFVSNGWGPLG